MKKQELLDIILDLPPKQREQLAAEIYQSLDALEDDLNTGWIVEVNHRMQRLEDTPPALPEEDYNVNDEYDESEETTEVPDYKMIENVWAYIDRMRFHFTLDLRVQRSRHEQGIPGEQVMQNIKKRMHQREELLGGLEPTPGPAPDVTAVRALDGFKLHLTFEDGEQRIFDMKPFTRGIFSQLNDPEYFSWVRLHWGGIKWLDGESMGARKLYNNSEAIKK